MIHNVAGQLSYPDRVVAPEVRWTRTRTADRDRAAAEACSATGKPAVSSTAGSTEQSQPRPLGTRTPARTRCVGHLADHPYIRPRTACTAGHGGAEASDSFSTRIEVASTETAVSSSKTDSGDAPHTPSPHAPTAKRHLRGERVALSSPTAQCCPTDQSYPTVHGRLTVHDSPTSQDAP